MVAPEPTWGGIPTLLPTTTQCLSFLVYKTGVRAVATVAPDGLYIV